MTGRKVADIEDLVQKEEEYLSLYNKVFGKSITRR